MRATPFKYRTPHVGPVERPVSLSGDELAAAMNASRDLPMKSAICFCKDCSRNCNCPAALRLTGRSSAR